MLQETYMDQEPYYKPQDLSYLEDWVFHFNSFTEEWAAIPRNKYDEYWNQYNHPDVLRSRNLISLLDLLHKSKGDREVIEKLTSG
jgi:hypothetical protein